MAATFSWGEDNGNAAGSPAKGTTRDVAGVNQVNWKNIDDVDSAYTSYPVTAGGNSFTKYQFGMFSGTFTQISNVKWAHTSGTFGAGLTLYGFATSGYATPATGANAALTWNMTATVNVETGGAILMSSLGPERAGATTLAAPGFTQYLATQLRTTTAAAAGDTAVIGFTLRYDEQ